MENKKAPHNSVSMKNSQCNMAYDIRLSFHIPLLFQWLEIWTFEQKELNHSWVNLFYVKRSVFLCLFLEGGETCSMLAL